MEQPPLPREPAPLIAIVETAGAPMTIPPWTCADRQERYPILVELLRNGAPESAIIALCMQPSSAHLGLEG